MDPQATWNELQSAYQARDWETTRELAQALLDWLDRDGFVPSVSVEQPLSPLAQRTVVENFCRMALAACLNAADD
jgi:hypothetical protein